MKSRRSLPQKSSHSWFSYFKDFTFSPFILWK